MSTETRAAGSGKPSAAETYGAILSDLAARWERAKSQGHSGVERTVTAAYRVESRPTVAEFGPYRGQRIVKALYLPVVVGVAHGGGTTLSAVHSDSPTSDWVPVERLAEWDRNAEAIHGGRSEYPPDRDGPWGLGQTRCRLAELKAEAAGPTGAAEGGAA